MENQDFVRQQPAPPPAALGPEPSTTLDSRPSTLDSHSSPLDFIAARRELFARQGSVAASWRRCGAKTYGPYYCLRYRDGGVSRSIYLGRAGAVVDRVRQALHALQSPLRQCRVLNQLRRSVRDALRIDRRDVDARLRRLGLRLKGFEVRGWRSSPLAALMRSARPSSRWLESMRPDPCRLPRVRQLRFVPAGGAAKWYRENRPKIPRLPQTRLETFLNARDECRN